MFHGVVTVWHIINTWLRYVTKTMSGKRHTGMLHQITRRYSIGSNFAERKATLYNNMNRKNATLHDLWTKKVL